MMNEIQKAGPKAAGRSSRPVITNNAIQMRMVRPQLRSRRRGSSSAGAEQCRRLEWRGRRASSKQETRHRTALSPRLHPAADGEEQADHHSHGSGQQAFAKQDSAQLSMDRIVAAAEPVGELEGSADHVEHAGGENVAVSSWWWCSSRSIRRSKSVSINRPSMPTRRRGAMAGPRTRRRRGAGRAVVQQGCRRRRRRCDVQPGRPARRAGRKTRPSSGMDKAVDAGRRDG